MPASLDAQAQQCTDLAAQLDGLLGGQVAQVLDLDLAAGVLVDGQGGDDADSVALAQLLQLSDDLGLEVRMFESQHDHLDRTDGISAPSLDRTRGVGSRAADPAASADRLPRCWCRAGAAASSGRDERPNPRRTHVARCPAASGAASVRRTGSAPDERHPAAVQPGQRVAQLRGGHPRESSSAGHGLAAQIAEGRAEHRRGTPVRESRIARPWQTSLRRLRIGGESVPTVSRPAPL
jgi:hypothetical protein